jgi:hypothetical protein
MSAGSIEISVRVQVIVYAQCHGQKRAVISFA